VDGKPRVPTLYDCEGSASFFNKRTACERATIWKATGY